MKCCTRRRVFSRTVPARNRGPLKGMKSKRERRKVREIESFKKSEIETGEEGAREREKR